MSDGSTVRILPSRLMSLGGGRAKLPNNAEPKAASTEIASRPMVSRAAPRSMIKAQHPGPASSEPNLEKSIWADLGEVEQAWRRYQGTHDRDAVYGYLAAVYNVVMKWKGEQRAWKSAGLVLRHHQHSGSVEPFAAVSRCTSDPEKVDGKTRSKWSQPLRVAKAFKGRDTSIREFIKG
jgi:hypothetical protein